MIKLWYIFVIDYSNIYRQLLNNYHNLNGEHHKMMVSKRLKDLFLCLKMEPNMKENGK